MCNKTKEVKAARCGKHESDFLFFLIELNELKSGVFTQAHPEQVLQCGRVHYTAKILGHTPSLTSLPIVHLGAISSPPSPPFSLFSVLLVLLTKNVSTVCT